MERVWIWLNEMKAYELKSSFSLDDKNAELTRTETEIINDLKFRESSSDSWCATYTRVCPRPLVDAKGGHHSSAGRALPQSTVENTPDSLPETRILSSAVRKVYVEHPDYYALREFFLPPGATFNEFKALVCSAVNVDDPATVDAIVEVKDRMDIYNDETVSSVIQDGDTVRLVFFQRRARLPTI